MRRRDHWQGIRLIVGLALIVGSFVGCGSDDDGGGGLPRIEEVLSDFRTADGLQAEVVRGEPPAASGGPTIMAPVAVTVPDATTQALTVTSDEEVEMLTLAVPGTDGYWVLDFGAIGPGAGAGTPVTSIDLLVGFATNPPLTSFDCLFNASDAGGAVGANETTAVTIDTCTVEELCSDACSPPEAASCLPFCDLISVLPDCALAINAPAACDAVTECLDSSDCDSAGECAESATDGLVDAACATQTCEAVP